MLVYLLYFCVSVYMYMFFVEDTLSVLFPFFYSRIICLILKALSYNSCHKPMKTSNLHFQK